MKTITSKHLKQRTGEVLKRVRAGEKITITYRGKPIAVIMPSSEKERDILKELRPFEEAWRDIETTLEQTEPQFRNWQEAMDWVRNRS